MALVCGVALHAQSQGGELPPSNLDPPQSQQAQPNEPSPPEPVKEPKSSIFDRVNLSDPKLYTKLGILLGSILLAHKAFQQMKSH
jgi:hypothetical protein